MDNLCFAIRRRSTRHLFLCSVFWMLGIYFLLVARLTRDSTIPEILVVLGCLTNVAPRIRSRM
jgi:hypothetical protein